MDKDEYFDEFYAKLMDIVNLAFNLGEQILEPKIVRKILRSLLGKFMPRSLPLKNQTILTLFL